MRRVLQPLWDKAKGAPRETPSGPNEIAAMQIEPERAERFEETAEIASLDARALAGRTAQELSQDCLREIHVLWHLLGESVAAAALAKHDAHPTSLTAVPPRRWAEAADELGAARRAIEDLLHAIDPARAADIVRAATALGVATASPRA